jgi:hypothetical protein
VPPNPLGGTPSRRDWVFRDFVAVHKNRVKRTRLSLFVTEFEPFVTEFEPFVTEFEPFSAFLGIFYLSISI